MTQDAKVKVTLEVNSSDLERALNKTRQDVNSANEALADSAKKAALAVGVAVSAASVFSVKAAVDFESAFAGVVKTVNATTDELDGLETGIRRMATELPAGAVEIANVAAAAGQLGIQTENILGFSRTMIDLGETTNLSAEEASTALAQLANITQMPQDQFDEFGSTVVALGNNLATTEAHIVDMSFRLAGAGEQVGLTEAEIASMAGVLASLGVRAELGGTAMSRVMLDIDMAVGSSSEKVAMFAEVAGLSATDFAQKWKNEPAEAMALFIEGLASVNANGGSVAQTLNDLGFEGTGVGDVFGRLSGSGTLLRESLELGNRAWEENTALAEEAGKRYETTASQLSVTKNQLNEQAIAFGTTLLPAMVSTLAVTNDFISAGAEVAHFLDANSALLAGAATTVGLFSLAVGIATGSVTVNSALTAIDTVVKVANTAATWAATAAAAALAIATSPLLPIFLAIGAAVTGLILLYQNWEEVTDAVSRGIGWLGEKLRELYDNSEVVRVVVDAVVRGAGFLKDAWNSMADATYAAAQRMVGMADSAQRADVELGYLVGTTGELVLALSEADKAHVDLLVSQGRQAEAASYAREKQQEWGQSLSDTEKQALGLVGAFGDMEQATEEMYSEIRSAKNEQASLARESLKLASDLAAATAAEAAMTVAAEEAEAALTRQNGITKEKGETTDDFKDRLREAGFEEEFLATMVDDTVASMKQQLDGTIMLYDETGNLVRAYRDYDGSVVDVTDRIREQEAATDGARVSAGQYKEEVERVADALGLWAEAQERVRSSTPLTKNSDGTSETMYLMNNDESFGIAAMQDGSFMIGNSRIGVHKNKSLGEAAGLFGSSEDWFRELVTQQMTAFQRTGSFMTGYGIRTDENGNIVPVAGTYGGTPGTDSAAPEEDPNAVGPDGLTNWQRSHWQDYAHLNPVATSDGGIEYDGANGNRLVARPATNTGTSTPGSTTPPPEPEPPWRPLGELIAMVEGYAVRAAESAEHVYLQYGEGTDGRIYGTTAGRAPSFFTHAPGGLGIVGDTTMQDALEAAGLRYFAQGGVVSGPTLAILGDNPSGREMVVPLERADEFGFGKGGGRDGPLVWIENLTVLDGRDFENMLARFGVKRRMIG